MASGAPVAKFVDTLPARFERVELAGGYSPMKGGKLRQGAAYRQLSCGSPVSLLGLSEPQKAATSIGLRCLEVQGMSKT